MVVYNANRPPPPSTRIFFRDGDSLMIKRYVVRHGRMNMLGEFVGVPGYDHARSERVVIRTERGTEIGEVLAASTARTASLLGNPHLGEIVRVVTDDDLKSEGRLIEARNAGFAICREAISKRRLQMDLVDVEAILGGERLVFY